MSSLPKLDAQDVLSLHCPLCAFHSHWTHRLEAHFFEEHKNCSVNFSLYRCTLCRKVASSKAFINEHLELHHRTMLSTPLPQLQDHPTPGSPSSDSDALIVRSWASPQRTERRSESTPSTRAPTPPVGGHSYRALEIFTGFLEAGLLRDTVEKKHEEEDKKKLMAAATAATINSIKTLLLTVAESHFARGHQDGPTGVLQCLTFVVRWSWPPEVSTVGCPSGINRLQARRTEKKRGGQRRGWVDDGGLPRQHSNYRGRPTEKTSNYVVVVARPFLPEAMNATRNCVLRCRSLATQPPHHSRCVVAVVACMHARMHV
ncbi:unnamed protein product [Schistocephalus solidus]|uniref:C2H2-type domain-containing protein n=1 Tax=Schistocephalus solidus TaxID=70667 RepID=A0A183SQA0_SCHSO|nr:unnamed protein product [Schistocephalus solidus]